MTGGMALPVPEPGIPAPLARLSRLHPLAETEIAAWHAAQRSTRRVAARRVFVLEGGSSRERRALLKGWACEQTILCDGRRQIQSFILPGDLFASRHLKGFVAQSSVFAITDLVTCAVPVAISGSSLAEAYARADTMTESYLRAHITRLGKLDSLERVAHLLLELRDRLMIADAAVDNRCALPLTQEMLADALGITTVHVNRMLGRLRQEAMVVVQGGTMDILDPERLQEIAQYEAVRFAPQHQIDL